MGWGFNIYVNDDIHPHPNPPPSRGREVFL